MTLERTFMSGGREGDFRVGGGGGGLVALVQGVRGDTVHRRTGSTPTLYIYFPPMGTNMRVQFAALLAELAQQA